MAKNLRGESFLLQYIETGGTIQLSWREPGHYICHRVCEQCSMKKICKRRRSAYFSSSTVSRVKQFFPEYFL